LAPEQRQIARAAPDSPNKRREQSARAAHSSWHGQFHRSQLTLGRNLRMGSACYLALVLLAGVANAHEYFPEKCPAFTPMQGFDWEQFADGVWYVTQKFATKSTCLTYEFTTDELGFKEITQLRQLPYSEKVGLDHEYKYTGKLYAANEALPAKMNVRFPLNPIGAASFVVLDTDYTSYGLICTCQEIDLFITTGHRRSCSMLQRAVEEDEAITSKLTELLDSQVPDSSHDFDPIKQEGCEHGREKAWTIDPEKVIGGGVGSSVREAVDQIANEFEFKTADQVKEEAEAALI